MRKGLLVFIILILTASMALVACSSSTPSTSVPATSAAPAQPPVTSSAATTAAPPATTAAPATSSAAPAKPSSQPSPTGGPQYGGILKILTTASPAILGYPPDADPNTNSLGAAATESLVYNDQTGSATPRLATDWKVAPDGKSVTFTLRKGVKYHDGTDFNAQSVKAVLELSRAKAGTDISKMVASIDVVDDYTVRLNLTQFSNVLFNTLAFSGMISPTAIQKNGADWARTHIVGTGAFSQADFKRDVLLKFTKFADYWDKGKPYLDAIEYDIVADATTAQIAFKSGAAQFLLQPSPKVAADLKAQGFTVRNYPGSLWFLAPDSANKTSPYSNKSVREALEYALDRNAIANATGYGYSHAVNQLTGPLMTGYNPDIVGRPYNVAKAKQLLASAGYPTGFKTTLYALNTTDSDVLVAIQGYLNAVGINATIDLCDSGRWIQVRSGSGWTNGLMLTRTGQDPNLTQRLIPDIGGGALYYKNMCRPDQWDPLLTQASSAQTLEDRTKLLQQFMKMASDEAAVVPLWTGDDIGVLTNAVNCDYLIVHHVQWKPSEAWLSK